MGELSSGSSGGKVLFVCGRVRGGGGARAAAVVKAGTRVETQWVQNSSQSLYQPRTAPLLRCRAAAHRDRPEQAQTQPRLQPQQPQQPQVQQHQEQKQAQPPPPSRPDNNKQTQHRPTQSDQTKKSQPKQEKLAFTASAPRPPDVKKRRVFQLEDSDSDPESPPASPDADCSPDLLSQDEIPPTPPPPALPLNPRKRKVDKMFACDDGFMRTVKNEYLEEEVRPSPTLPVQTAPPKEEPREVKREKPEKPEGKAVAKNKKSPRDTRKQTNIMNFFGKK